MLGGFFQIDGFQHGAHGFSTNAHGEAVFAIGVLSFIKLIFVDQLTLSKGRDTGLNDDMALKIKHLFNVLEGHIQHQGNARWQGFQEPNVGDRCGQFDMAHALTAHPLQRDFYAALFAGDALIFDALILAAQAFIILDRSKDARAEETVALWLEGPIIDGLWLFDFAIGPSLDLIRAG